VSRRRFAPAFGKVNIPLTQDAALQVTELVEDERRMVAGAGDLSVVAGMGKHLDHSSATLSASRSVIRLSSSMSSSAKVGVSST
jgi:hypothetical protein